LLRCYLVKEPTLDPQCDKQKPTLALTGRYRQHRLISATLWRDFYHEVVMFPSNGDSCPGLIAALLQSFVRVCFLQSGILFSAIYRFR
jgi:hypothetical protein